MAAKRDNKSILSAGELIRQTLTINADVSAITNKVFPVVTDKATLPYVLYRRVSMEQQPNKGGWSYADVAQIEVICFAATYSGSVQLAEAVRGALDGAQISGDGLVLRSCYLSDSEEAWQDDAFVQAMTYTIKI